MLVSSKVYRIILLCYRRSVMRRLKLYLLHLKRKAVKRKPSPARYLRRTLRVSGVLSASPRLDLTNSVLNLTSVALSFLLKPRVRWEGNPGLVVYWCWFYNLTLVVCAELTRLKMELEGQSSAGLLTNAADRKLQEGQRVSNRSVFTKSWRNAKNKTFFLLLNLFIFDRTYKSCAWTCRGWELICSLGSELVVATREGRGCGTR